MWLNKLLDNRQFDLFAPIIVLALSGWLLSDFIRTRRAVKRGDPLRVWYLRYPVYPDDLLYSYYAFQRQRPAFSLLIFLALLVLVFGALIIWGTFCPPPPN